MQQLSSSQPYRKAFEALTALKEQLGVSDELKAIAAYLFHSANAEIPEAMFPYVELPGDTRDEAIAQAYQSEWKRLVAGEYEDDEF